MIKLIFALPGASASCVEHPGSAVRGRVGAPQVIIIVVVFAWVLAAAALGILGGTLIGLLTAAGTVAAHLIGRTGPDTPAAAADGSV